MDESSAKENILTDEEIEEVERSLNDFREKLVFRGLLYTGLRVSTFVHIRESWIREGKIFVPKEDRCYCRECKGKWTPKTKASVRSVPLLERAKGVLERLFSRYERPLDLVGTRNNVNNILKGIEERADIRSHLHPHGLRGTHASLLAKEGVNVWHIRDQLGWSTIEPAKFYVRTFGTEREEKIREAFGEA